MAGRKKEKKAAVKPSVVVDQGPSPMQSAARAVLSFTDSRILLYALMIAFPCMVMLYHPNPWGDYDIWWHLKLGEYYVQNHTLRVDHAIFSWTPADSGWIYNTWLGSTIFYIAYTLLSGFGMWLIQWLVFGGLFFLYYLYVRSTGSSFSILDLAGLLPAAVVLNNILKPEIFSTLLFALSVFLYFYCKTHNRPRLFFFYPPIFLLWVNLHGGYLLGLALVSMLLAGEALNHWFFKRHGMSRQWLLHLASSVGLSYLAVLINPYGIDYHIFNIQALFSETYTGGAADLLAYYSLWPYLSPSKFITYRFFGSAWAQTLLAAVFCALCLYAYFKKRVLDWTLIAFNLFFFFFGMSGSRYSFFYPLFALFSMLYLLHRIQAPDLKRNLKPAALALFLILSGFIVFTSLCLIDQRTWFGKGLDELAPVKEVEFIMKNKLPPPLFNDYYVGGYMIWKMYPEYKVMIDPRYGPYVKQLMPDYNRLIGGLHASTINQFLERYPAKVALLHYIATPIIYTMMQSGEWSLVYFEQNAAVLVHKTLIPSLQKEALDADTGPERFKDVKDATVLNNLFRMYILFSPEPEYAQAILDIYRQNVSDLYWFKESMIRRMEGSISRKKEEIRRRMFPMQQ
jgi:hypothetical protein